MRSYLCDVNASDFNQPNLRIYNFTQRVISSTPYLRFSLFSMKRVYKETRGRETLIVQKRKRWSRGEGMSDIW